MPMKGLRPRLRTGQAATMPWKTEAGIPKKIGTGQKNYDSVFR